MIMELTYLLLNNSKIADWSSEQLEFINKLSHSEIEIILNNVQNLKDNSIIQVSSTWKS